VLLFSSIMALRTLQVEWWRGSAEVALGRNGRSKEFVRITDLMDHTEKPSRCDHGGALPKPHDHLNISWYWFDFDQNDRGALYKKKGCFNKIEVSCSLMASKI